ncbi:thioredoxin [Patescibacteria group bacterium]|nr:thioredoxin [Patescibacteria group bacterium]
MAVHFTDKDFAEEVTNSKVPVLVDFFAEWCGPCRALAPLIDELTGEFEGKVKIGKMDVDSNPDTAQSFGIMSIPTLVFFKDGKEVDRVSGVLPKETLTEKLNALL